MVTNLATDFVTDIADGLLVGGQHLLDIVDNRRYMAGITPYKIIFTQPINHPLHPLKIRCRVLCI